MKGWRGLLYGLFMVACSSESLPPPTVNPTPPPLQVELAGCSDMWEGPQCAPGEGPLNLWVSSSPQATITLRLDGQPASAERTPVAGGLRLTLSPKPDARRLSVAAEQAGAVSRWHLQLRPDPPLAALQQARELRDAGSETAAIEHLVAARPPLSPEAQGRVDSALARLHLRAGRDDRAIRLLRRAMLAHRRSGRLRALIWDGVTLAFRLTKGRGDKAGARAALRELQAPLRVVDEGVIVAQHAHSIIQREGGDLAGALSHLDEAVQRAERLGLHALARQLRPTVANTLVLLGRLDEAEQELSSLLDGLSDATPQELRRVVLTSLCWVRIMARERSGPMANDPTKPCTSALALSSKPEQQANVHINLGLAAQQRSNTQQARLHVQAIKALGITLRPYLAGWLEELEARLLLSEGHTALAMQRYDARLAQAQRSLSVSDRWRASVGRGQVLEAVGRPDDAGRAYGAAEDALDEQSLSVPLIAGRDTFLAERERSARLLIDLLIRTRRPERALQVARRSRARLLISLYHNLQLAELTPGQRVRWEHALAHYRSERAAIDGAAAEDWKLARNALEARLGRRRRRMREASDALERALAVGWRGRSPAADAAQTAAAGELLLAYHPTDDGWIAFAAISDTTVAVRITPPKPLRPSLGQPSALDLAALSQTLLAPFDALLQQAQRLTILPYGPLRTVDFHALPWRGKPLIASLPVVYKLDLPRPVDDAADGQQPLALLVADPNQNLPHARREATTARDGLAHAGWRLQTLLGGQATHAAVSAALEQSQLFHYAGHGHFAGRAGWQSALPLAKGTQLTLGDILALRRGPEQVVLSGCETGRAGRSAAGETLSIAHVFVARGAKQVVAAVRPVSDSLAHDISRALYQQVTRAGFADLAASLRAAQLQVQASSPRADWSSYRVIVP